jgi:hypothetical protein
MAEFALFRPQIVNIGIAGLDLQGHPFLYFKTVTLETENFLRIVG